jgi:ABC-type sugar transport system ATPase subunit
MSTGTELRFALSSGDELVVPRGRVTAACGENGSGLDVIVTAVTKAILAPGGERRPGVRPPFALTDGAPYALVDRRRGLTPMMDVAENVYLGLERKRRLGPLSLGIDWKLTREDAAADLALVGARVPVTTKARELGEFDRMLVELARAVARRAELVVLDEPTALLTPDEGDRLLGVIRDFAARGVAVLVLTQKPRQALGYADEVVVVRDGEVAGRHERGEWAGSLADEASVRDRILGELVDRPPRRLYPSRARAAADAGELLRVSAWTVHDPIDPRATVVEDAGLVVSAGEIVGVAGLQRSGAETLLLSVYGRSAGTDATGAVFIDGEPADTSTVERAIANGLFFAATDMPSYRVRFVGGIAMPVSPARLSKLAAAGLVDRDSDLRAGDGWGTKVLGAVRSISREGDQGSHIRGLVREFAASERRVLMLGNPTAGSTDEERSEIYAGLARIAAAGKGVVLFSSDLDELLGVCDRVVTMAAGRVTGEVPGGTAPHRVAELIAPN